MTVLQPDTLLDGRYRIISHLAEGGFGHTYLAEDTRQPSRPKCVVKQLKPGISNSQMLDAARRLFRTEAETLEKLGEHKQIPRLLANFNKDEDFYLVQELIKGNNLSEELKLGEPWSESQIYQMLQEVLEILGFVHDNKVIHRDIKPDNIIRRYEDKKLVLVDFGSVKQIRDYEGQINGTVVVGTRGYMPTEQGRGSPRCNSDIYALGMIAIQAATGLNIHQFQEDSNTGEIIWQPWAKGISDDLAFILTKMVRHHFIERYQSTQEVLQAIKPHIQPGTKILSPEPVNPLPPIANHTPIFGNSLKRNLPIVSLIALIITLFGIIAWLLTSTRNVQTTDPNPIPIQPIPPDPFHSDISSGEIALLKKEETGNTNQSFQKFKKQGMDAMRTGDYSTAVGHFENALKKYPNAPETRIYLNNALSQVKNQKTYTIAAVVPISLDLEAAQAMLRGVAQAQNTINKSGGINGVPLRVVIANDGDTEETAEKIASELGLNKEVLGVVGHYYSSRTLAAGKTYEKNKLVAIALSSSTEIENFSPYVFRTSPSDDLTAQALANYMLTKLKRKKVAIFYDPNSKYSKSLKQEFSTAINNLRGEVVAEAYWSVNNFDANYEVTRAIEIGAEVLMLVPDNAEQLDKALQVAEMSRKNQLELLGGDVMYAFRTLDFGAVNVLDMVIGAFWHIDANPNAKFSIESKKLWDGAKVNWISAMAYDATQALVEAFHSNPDPSRVEVQQILSNQNFSASGASNPVRFTNSGNRHQPKIQLVKVVKDSKSKTGYRFEPISD